MVQIMSLSKAIVFLMHLEELWAFSSLISAPVEFGQRQRRVPGRVVVVVPLLSVSRQDCTTTTTSLNNAPSTVSSFLSNEDLRPGIEAIDQYNEELFQCLESMRQVPYFRFFSVDILGSCEYIPQELFECYTEGCEILPIDENLPAGDEEKVR